MYDVRPCTHRRDSSHTPTRAHMWAKHHAGEKRGGGSTSPISVQVNFNSSATVSSGGDLVLMDLDPEGAWPFQSQCCSRPICLEVTPKRVRGRANVEWGGEKMLPP